MKLLHLWLVPAIAFLAACSSEEYTPYVTRGLTPVHPEIRDQFTLQRTACFGVCPVYKVTVDDRDLLLFEGERFVAETGGSVSKRLPDGSFKKLIDIAKAHGFSSFDKTYPNEDGSNCPQMATDMPSVIIAFEAKKLAGSISLYQGCLGFDGRKRLDDMILQIDAVLDIDDLIGPREDFYGEKE